ncbi:MAG: trypsin-like peptidase domain-containing protein [Nitrososphaeraceae archaeon]
MDNTSIILSEKHIFTKFHTFGLLLLVSTVLSFSITSQSVSAETSSLENDGLEKDFSLSELFHEVEKSVVQISNKDDSIDINPFGSRLGSGFVYDTQGHIITNNHVVSNSELLHVTFSDGTIYTAKVVGTDPYSDLAVILLEDVPEQKLLPLNLGNSSQLIVGEPVAAVGNPFGLSGSLTEGIISGLGRLLPSSTSQDQFSGQQRTPSFSIPDIIQTDAAINPGNSGGPLLNLNGEVIGINSAIFSNTGVYAGVGFAISSDTVKKVIPALINAGTYQHPWIGITGIDVTPEIAEKMNLTEPRGFLVIDVNSGSPADEAGIHGGDRLDKINGREIELGGDVIIAIDKNPVRKIADILSHLEREREVGDNISLTLIRGGEILESNATLIARPNSGDLNKLNQPLSLGITGIDVTPEIAEKMNLTEPRGFLVIDVNSGSPADKAGIHGGFKIESINNTQIRLGGDVIIQIDNKSVNTVSDLSDYIKEKKENDIVNLKIIRNGEEISLDAVLEVYSNPNLLGNNDELLIEPRSRDSLKNNQEFLNELKKECTRNFSDDICNFLFK